MGWSSMSRTLGIIGVLGFLIAAFTPFVNVLARWQATPGQLEPAEAIVVLGADSAGRDGTLGTTSLRRVIHGIVLHRRGLAPLLVLSGHASPEGRSEAEARADLARVLGVSSDGILTESGARTTREEAERIRELLRPHAVRRILLVTDSPHMMRARGVFERAGFEVLPAPADDSPLLVSRAPEDRLQVLRRILQAYAARFYYRVAGYL